MATFFVAHGAWSAGWAWKKMHPLLRERGHALVVPTQTGLGERAHLAGPEIDLETHVADLLGALHCEDLHDVILLGHSYGGMVATVLADRAPERFTQLVYLDAFVPLDGQALIDLVPPALSRSWPAADWRTPPNPLPPDTSPEDVAWILPRRVPQPRRCFTQPVKLTGAGGALPRTYIFCTRQAPGEPFRPFAERARRERDWRYLEIDATHSPNVTAPDALARLLDGIARGAA
ncbi:MAG TPA: alpha/beta hydrolase [Methylomirabilota bacterium]|nr:alpha/beta hydrolase [Methylomirabilota bacterium]